MTCQCIMLTQDLSRLTIVKHLFNWDKQLLQVHDSSPQLCKDCTNCIQADKDFRWPRAANQLSEMNSNNLYPIRPHCTSLNSGAAQTFAPTATS